MPGDWSRAEVEACVTDYLAMLEAELRGVPYNKTEHRRALRHTLDNRSDASVERKHMNISAVLMDRGHPWIPGYKPYSNYQQLLAEVVADRLRVDRALVELVETQVSSPASVPSVADLLMMWESPPATGAAGSQDSSETTELPYNPRPGPHRNYLALEASNQSLGRAGEKLVLEYEAQRLRQEGAPHLAGRVEHIAATKGDGYGYDILSFDSRGRERLIEVKTTRYGKDTPFYITRTELACSTARPEEFHLYRIYAFGPEPRMFGLQGRVNETCRLSATQYRAQVT